jgi:exodeoxyribonuclease V alpha subunit
VIITRDQLDPSQAAAVELLTTQEPICVVTGGPGRGKSACLNVALDDLERDGARVELASPTGKAASRMTETTGRPARTIHRLLGYHPIDGFSEEPVDADVVVIDEASMVDISLFARLLERLRPYTSLALIGDADQLPSVGPGQVLRDLVDAPEIATARLTTLHRAAAHSWVANNAPLIIEGKMPGLGAMQPDFAFSERQTLAEAADEAVGMVVDDQRFQVLTPQAPGPGGTNAINERVQDALRSECDPHAVVGDRRFFVGDKVVQTVNDYDLGVFNGETGVVEDVLGESAIVACFGKELVEVRGPRLLNLRLAYAMTIHKSQGSEWQHVVVIAHQAHAHLLNRSLLYTAITRAKQSVAIVGTAAGVKAAVSRGSVPRNTALMERVRRHG